MQETENHCAVNSRMQERRSWDRKVGMGNLHEETQAKFYSDCLNKAELWDSREKFETCWVGSDSQKCGS